MGFPNIKGVPFSSSFNSLKWNDQFEEIFGLSKSPNQLPEPDLSFSLSWTGRLGGTKPTWRSHVRVDPMRPPKSDRGFQPPNFGNAGEEGHLQCEEKSSMWLGNCPGANGLGSYGQPDLKTVKTAPVTRGMSLGRSYLKAVHPRFLVSGKFQPALEGDGLLTVL